MSPGSTLILLASVQFAAVLSPGPNTALVLQNAARDRQLGFATAVGYWPAGACWAALGLAGIGSLLSLAPWLGLGLRIVCGFYLVMLGAKALIRSFGPFKRGVEALAPSLRQAFASGFLTNLTNPKSIAFYMSVFSATGALTLPVPDQIVAVVLLPSIGLVYYGGLAWLISSRAVKSLHGAVAPWLDRVAGAAMMCFGCKLLVAR